MLNPPSSTLQSVGFILIFKIKHILQGFAGRDVTHQGCRHLLMMALFAAEVQIRCCPVATYLNPSKIAPCGSRPAAGRVKLSSWRSCTGEDGAATLFLPSLPPWWREGIPQGHAVPFRGAVAALGERWGCWEGLRLAVPAAEDAF